MRRTILTIAAVSALGLTVAACGSFDRTVTENVTGYSRVCVAGVSYLQFPSGVTVEYTTIGHVKAC